MAAATTVDAAPRGAFFSPGNAPRAPEIMLYFSHSVGTGAGAGSMRPTFGLRVQQIRQAANSGDPESGNPMQHRELINWQMEGHSNLRLSDLRVKLGNKLTYDIASRRFGSPQGRSVMQLGTPSMRSGMPGFTPLRSFAAHSPVDRISVSSAGRDLNRDDSNFREVAVAAMAAVAPTRFTAAQRQMSQHQRGMTSIAAAQRMQGVPALR